MADVKQKNLTNAQRAKAAHEAATKQRAAEQQTIKAAYLSGNGELVLADLRKKIPLWINLNNKVAQDGVGSRPTGYKLTDGSPETELIYLTPAQRAAYLDESKGMQKILDYIERQLTVGNPGEQIVKGEEEEADEEGEDEHESSASVEDDAPENPAEQ